MSRGRGRNDEPIGRGRNDSNCFVKKNEICIFRLSVREVCACVWVGVCVAEFSTGVTPQVTAATQGTYLGLYESKSGGDGRKQSTTF